MKTQTQTAAAHTPGPWELPLHPLSVEKRTCNEHGGDIEANARLIAAAPELLAALKIAEDTLRNVHSAESRGNRITVADIALAAIVKAEGAL